MGVRTTVHNGRLVVDEATGLPEGTAMDLVVDDEGERLDIPGRQALAAAISRSIEHAARGEVAPASKILSELRDRRSE